MTPVMGICTVHFQLSFQLFSAADLSLGSMRPGLAEANVLMTLIFDIAVPS